MTQQLKDTPTQATATTVTCSHAVQCVFKNVELEMKSSVSC